MSRELTKEYIRGLVEGEGCFTFNTRGYGNAGLKEKVPSFQLRMHIRDRKLLELVRDYLKLKNKIYIYHYPGKDGAKRGSQAILIVREFGNLKNIIIPLFYNKLLGNKALQFNEWLEKIGSDQMVPASYKLFYRLHKSGFYSRIGGGD